MQPGRAKLLACLLWRTLQNSAKLTTEASTRPMKLPEPYMNCPKISLLSNWNIAHASFLTLLVGKKADDGLQSAEGSIILKSKLGQFYLSFERSSP